MAQISIIGIEGKPVLYASLTSEGKLFFEFELYARNENEGDYYLYPIESNFNRIYIRLLDKKNILLTKSYLSRFVMKLCVYYYTKKISQF